MAARRYAIIGTGAIGGYYGACLQRSGIEVHFLLHRDYAWVAQQGLVVNSVDGDFALPRVNAHATTATMPSVDVVVIALKTTQNHLLTALLPPLLGPTTAVLTLQNGFDIESALAWVGDRPIVGSVLYLRQQNRPRHHSPLRLWPFAAGRASGRSPTGRHFTPAERSTGRLCRRQHCHRGDGRPAPGSLAQADVEYPLQRPVGGDERHHR